MRLGTFDFETYSEAGFIWNERLNKYTPPLGAKKCGLPTIGVAKYAKHPSTEVLCMSYEIGQGIKTWKPGEVPPIDLFLHIRDGGLLEAWNVSFEEWIWREVCVPKYGFPELLPRQLRCAMAKSKAYSLPASLEEAGNVLNISNKKDKRGKKLLDLYSKPCNPTKKNPERRHVIEDFTEMLEYNMQDVRAEMEISALVPDLIPSEYEYWQIDQGINRRGVQVDLETVDACISIVQRQTERLTTYLKHLTDGEVKSASEVAKIIKFLARFGIHTDTLDEEAVGRLLKIDNLPDAIRKILVIRSLLSSAAVKKLYAFRNRTCDNGRMYDLFVYHAARTGRSASYGVQVQNLPNSGVTVGYCVFCQRYSKFPYGDQCSFCASPVPNKNKEWSREACENAIDVIKTRSLEFVKLCFGEDILDTVSSCIRGLIISAPGHDLICSDYSAIEAVVLAALAGEEWRLEVFRTHGKIYEMSASKISGVPFEEFLKHKEKTDQHHPLRKSLGKVAELASGFGGGLGAWKRFGADEHLSEEEIQRAIYAWRDASPHIVQLWSKYQECALNAIMSPGDLYEYRGIKFFVEYGVLKIQLLSGRTLIYHKPSVTLTGRPEIMYWGHNSNALGGVMGWSQIKTYGGKLTENIVQATARDILTNAIVNLETSGYPVVMHIHDEIVCEVPEWFGSVEDMEGIMNVRPSWCSDWPIKVSGGWRGKRYGK